jgi:hypothetical protein
VKLQIKKYFSKNIRHRFEWPDERFMVYCNARDLPGMFKTGPASGVTRSWLFGVRDNELLANQYFNQCIICYYLS